MSIEQSASPVRPGRIAAWLARHVEVGLAAVDLSLAQYRLLVLLESDSPAASALADRLAVSRPSVTAVVDGLVARGLVRRAAAADDRRRVTHEVTAEGRRLLATADDAVDQRLTEILGSIGDPARRDRGLDGLACWQTALLAYRDARLGAPDQPVRDPAGAAR